jgi:hypothetical protein
LRQFAEEISRSLLALDLLKRQLQTFLKGPDRLIAI